MTSRGSEAIIRLLSQVGQDFEEYKLDVHDILFGPREGLAQTARCIPVAVCKRCGSVMPLGQRICDMCGGPQASTAKPWQPPVEAPPVQLASSAARWNNPAPPPPQVADQGITVPSYVSVASLRAPFWMRAIALIIDGVVVGIPSYALAVVVLQQGLAGRSGIQLLLSLIYFGYFWTAAEKGQTLGMSLFNLHVVKTDGSYLDGGRAFIRYIGFFIAQSALGLGLLWAAFDANKQGWHDKIAGTYVIRAAS